MVRRLAYGLFAPAVGFLMDRYGPQAGLTLCGLFGLAGMIALAPTLRTAAPAPVVPELPRK
jgi:MFS family permease